MTRTPMNNLDPFDLDDHRRRKVTELDRLILETVKLVEAERVKGKGVEATGLVVEGQVAG